MTATSRTGRAVTGDLGTDIAGDVSVEVIETSSLGDRSYLATDGHVGVVIDPQRDVDRVLAVAGRLGVRIALVLETHVHNDYVTGGLDLTRLTGAEYAMSGADEVSFPRRPLTDGDVLEVSDYLRVRVLATPGHTFNHLSYIVEGGRGPVGVFTGGSLLYGTTGRTDLLGEEHTSDLAHRQHASARVLADALPDGVQIWPTHGFGSFCAASAASQAGGTLGEQKTVNPALTLGERDFVEQTLAGLDAYPAYYAHMGMHNTEGPAPLDLRPPTRASAAELAKRLKAGEWVVDLRTRQAYVRSHLAGTVSLGLDGPMATWLGWMLDWGSPITLVANTSDQVADAQRELSRIGISGPDGNSIPAAAIGEPEDLAADPAQIRDTATATFDDLARALRPNGQEGPIELPPPRSSSTCGRAMNGAAPTSRARSTSRSTR